MPISKIALSPKELSMVLDREWILTKQLIIQKVYEMFEGRILAIRSAMPVHLLPENITSTIPKIYKGENYLQLPYVILDYPRCFEKENVFAVRTMFWWGNFFSITLHISGEYKDYVKEYLYTEAPQQDDELFIGINENQWQHHFEKDNFLPYGQFTGEERRDLYNKNSFIKLAVKFNIKDWNNMPVLLDEGYSRIAKMLFNSPGDEKAL